MWAGCNWLRLRSNVGFYEYDYEPAASVKAWNFWPSESLNSFSKSRPHGLSSTVSKSIIKIVSPFTTKTDRLYSAVLLVSIRLEDCQTLTAWVAPDIFKITHRHGPQRKHIFPILLRRSVYRTIA
jgi:hypothetical protein